MIHSCDILILGAGFSGLSASYHLGHEQCVILEKNSYPFGHCASHQKDGSLWDEGPHVSFTKHEYVRKLFEESVDSEFVEYEVIVGNYYKGVWVDHPAQVNLYQIPEPLRSQCLNSFQQSPKLNASPKNYKEWLNKAFGEVFAQNFPAAYTKKYWTCEPDLLETSWVGERVYRPNEQDVVDGSKGRLAESKHYITKVRYPKNGGYESFANILYKGADIKHNHEVESIDLVKKEVRCSNGDVYQYSTLISTIPLPLFVRTCLQVTDNVLEASKLLSCSSGYLVNVLVPHKATRPENWLYVYDEDKLSTRITFVEKLDGGANNKDYSAIQVEVYHSKYRKLHLTEDEILNKVIDELGEMGLIDDAECKVSAGVKAHITSFEWGNVIFDHHRKGALNTVLDWLVQYGLKRELDDLEHSTNWSAEDAREFGDVILAGRFGQWKYYWSDDCVLRGKQIGNQI